MEQVQMKDKKEFEISQLEEKEEDLFSKEEITIEELAIDGICGVY